jgi:hypothetical protein
MLNKIKAQNSKLITVPAFHISAIIFGGIVLVTSTLQPSAVVARRELHEN